MTPQAPRRTESAHSKRTRGWCAQAARVAAALAFLLVWNTGVAVQESSSSLTSLEEWQRSSLAPAAMAHNFHRTRDLGLVMEQVFLAKRFMEGASPDTATRDTVAKRHEWARLKNAAATGEWSSSGNATNILLRLAGRLGTHVIGGGSSGVEIANLLIHDYEKAMKGQQVSMAVLHEFVEAHRWSKEGSVLGFYQEIERKYVEEPEFGSAWDTLYLPRYGYRPNASVDEVTTNDPDFAMNSSVRSMLSAIKAGRHVLAEIEGNQNRILEEAEKLRQDMSLEESGFVQETRERWALEEAEKERLRLAKIAEIEIEGIRSAVALGATFIGFSDPELGRQISATSHAMFTVRDGIKGFQAAVAIGANENLAAAVLTGDVVGAVLALASAFIDTGPSENQIIIGQISKLRKEVQNVRKEMHERFDGVHKHLDKVYEDMLHGFEVLVTYHEGQARQLRNIIRGLENTSLRLDDIGGVQLDTQSIIVHQGELLMKAITDIELAACRREDYDPSQGDPMPLTRFRDCRAKIETLSDLLPQQQVGTDWQAPETLDKWLAARPDRTISVSLKIFRQLLEKTGEEGATRAERLADSVVGPEAWFYVANLHDRFLAEHRTHAITDAEAILNSKFRVHMRRYRSDLEQYAEAIRDELAALQAESRPTAFSKLLETAWNGREVESLARDRTRTDLLASPEFKGSELRMSIAGAHLRAWIALALYDAIGRSDLVTAIATGRVGFPDVRAVFEQSRGDVYAEWAVDEVGREIRALEDTLRSPVMQDAVKYGYGHRVLFGTRFHSLDSEP